MGLGDREDLGAVVPHDVVEGCARQSRAHTVARALAIFLGVEVDLREHPAALDGCIEHAAGEEHAGVGVEEVNEHLGVVVLAAAFRPEVFQMSRREHPELCSDVLTTPRDALGDVVTRSTEDHEYRVALLKPVVLRRDLEDLEVCTLTLRDARVDVVLGTGLAPPLVPGEHLAEVVFDRSWPPLGGEPPHHPVAFVAELLEVDRLLRLPGLSASQDLGGVVWSGLVPNRDHATHGRTPPWIIALIAHEKDFLSLRSERLRRGCRRRARGEIDRIWISDQDGI